MPRIIPLAPPYSQETDEALRRWMPPNAAHEPLVLFRALHRNVELASRMRVLGAGLLVHGRLPAADREVVIARVCARCGCRYEWGVHAAVFAGEVGLSPEQLQATVTGNAEAHVWNRSQAALIRAVDELHDTARLSQPTWDAVREHYDAAQMLEFLVLAGWYRTISYVANGLLLDDEPWVAPVPEHDDWVDSGAHGAAR